MVSLIALTVLVSTGCSKTQNTTEENSDGDQTLIQRNQIAKFETELPDPCEFDQIDALNFSTDQETDWVTYRNSEKGLAISIPYNPNWGSPKYRLNAYDEYEDGLSFGTINVRGEGCGAWVPGTQRLDFIAAETKEEVLSRLQKESDELEFGYSIKSLSIDGKDVVEYIKDGMCGGGGTIVIGKKYNYEFSKTCSANTREDIIKTMEFTASYTSENHNVSFDYPSNWELNENESIQIVSPVSPPPGTNITITIPAKSFDEYESEHKDLIETGKMSIEDSNPTDIDNLTVKKYGQHGWLYYLIEVDGLYLSVGSEVYWTEAEKAGVNLILNSLSS